MQKRSILSVISVVLVLYVTVMDTAGHNGVDEGLRGIAYISVTTDNLTNSLRFYTQVLGGMQIKDLSFRFHGDVHYELFFQKELKEARDRKVDPASLGVPDISDKGSYEVLGEFVVFDNGLLQLIQFSLRDGSKSAAFPAYENRTSPAYIAAPHICFWVQDEVDFNHYIAELEANAGKLGFAKVKANRPVEVHSEAEREAVPESKFGITFQTGDFAGLSFAYFKGPSGEQLELYRITNESRYYLGRDYCRRRAVSTAFISNYSDNEFKRAAGVPGKLFGLIQFGTRTDNLWRSVDFYVNVLGANLVQRPLQASNIRGDDVENMLFQKELLNAEAWGVTSDELGIANISNSGNMRLDHRFNLFDNYVVETLLYIDGLTLGDPGYNPRYYHSSLAYINDMHVAFSIENHQDFDLFIRHFEHAAEANGFSQVKISRLPGTPDGSSYTFQDGPLKGFTYTTLNGPAGEHVAFVQFKGLAHDKLKQALIRYGAVSTTFQETNPWHKGDMDQFCHQYSGNVVGR